jgi:hypothetical protein
MRKLEAASVRKMLHRRRMRRRGGFGKGSVLVTGDVCRAVVSDCRYPYPTGSCSHGIQQQRKGRAFPTYQVGGQLPREGVGKGNHVESYCTASVAAWTLHSESLHCTHIRRGTRQCAAILSSHPSTAHSGRGTCSLWLRFFAGPTRANVSETTCLWLSQAGPATSSSLHHVLR